MLTKVEGEGGRGEGRNLCTKYTTMTVVSDASCKYEEVSQPHLHPTFAQNATENLTCVASCLQRVSTHTKQTYVHHHHGDDLFKIQNFMI